MTGVQFDPVDTLFFRDGTPFSAGSAPQDGVSSLFPPHPASVAGAVRAALARCNGWDGQGRWPADLDVVLGNGPEDLGALFLDGPFVLRCGQPLFRMSRHLLGANESGRWTPRVLLRPGRAIACDLGDAVRLPETPRPGDGSADLKTGDDWWLTQAGMEAVVRGELPATAETVSSSDLWNDEPRVGLERDGATRTALEGMLYSTCHVRLQRGVSIGVRVAGVPASWVWPFTPRAGTERQSDSAIVPLGGESRLAECRPWDDGVSFTVPPVVYRTGRMALISLTPLDLAKSICRGERPLDASAGVRVVSACLNRPQRIGGWNSLQRKPLVLRSVLPPGSVLFCEAADPGRFIDASQSDDGSPRIGSRQPWGFGHVAFGVWPDESEVTS